MQWSEFSQKGVLWASQYYTIQIQTSGKLSSLLMCLMDILGENRVLFKGFLYIQHCTYWAFVKRANHCWHSSTEKSLNFIHYCTHYSSSKVHALKVTLLCNSVNKIYFLSCSSVFGDFFLTELKINVVNVVTGMN